MGALFTDNESRLGGTCGFCHRDLSLARTYFTSKLISHIEVFIGEWFSLKPRRFSLKC